MLDFSEENERQYIQTVREKIQKNKKVVIYGAGRKGIGLFALLKKGGIEIDAFLVTNKKENKEEECGLKVYEIQEFDLNNTLVLIGVRQRWNSEVRKILHDKNCLNYIDAPDGIEYFGYADRKRSECTVLQVTVQVGCKINCKYCPQKLFIERYTADKTREISMSLADFKQCIDNIEGNVIIDFAGFSEPFLNMDCIEMIKYAHKKGHQIELFTTLEGLTENGFEQIKNIPFREVVLHIPDQERNSEIRITNEYLSLLQKVLSAKKPNGMDFADWASCHGEIADEILNIVYRKIRVISQLHDRAGNLANEELEQKHGIKGKIRCSNTNAEYHNHNVLLPDGSVLLCDSDWGMNYVLGNLKVDKYEKILCSRKMKEICALRNEDDSQLICRDCCYAINI